MIPYARVFSAIASGNSRKTIPLDFVIAILPRLRHRGPPASSIRRQPSLPDVLADFGRSLGIHVVRITEIFERYFER